MPTYSNGYIPDSLLVTFATGWSTNDGWWKHQLSPATYARHLALVKRAKDRTGRNLQITAGWGAYRPYASQVLAKRLYGPGAAAAGFSSHGGFWENKQTLAIDYHNWGSVYGWDQAAWFADCRAVGLTPGMIMRARGYPDEPWHVIDLAPWSSVPASGGATPLLIPVTPTPELEQEAEDMDYLFQIDPATDGRWVVANYRRGTLRVIPNGFQLDRIREEAQSEDRTIKELGGPQPPHAVAGLTVE